MPPPTDAPPPREPAPSDRSRVGRAPFADVHHHANRDANREACPRRHSAVAPGRHYARPGLSDQRIREITHDIPALMLGAGRKPSDEH